MLYGNLSIRKEKNSLTLKESEKKVEFSTFFFVER